MAIVKNLKDFRSQSHTTTLGVTFAFNNMFKKECLSRTFHTIGTSFVVCVVETIMKVFIALVYKNETNSLLSMTSRSFAISSNMSNM